MSEFDDFLKGKAKEVSTLDLSTLGDSFKAVITKKPEEKQDKRSNTAIYVELKTKEGTIVQKYGKSLYQTLSERMLACGGLKALMETEHLWKQEKAGRATFNRYYPVPNKTKKE